jgi:hypothetical protein
MTPSEALEYLTTNIALNYKPRRMPWEHDQDSPAVRQATLQSWVQLCAQHPTQTVYDAFTELMRHHPNQVPTRAELSNTLRNITHRQQPATRTLGTNEVCDPKRGYLLALEGYEQQCRLEGREPNWDRFNRIMAGLVK